MTPDRAARRKRRRIRLAIRRTSALAAAIAFFFAWGTIGAIETDAVSLVEERSEPSAFCSLEPASPL